MLKQINSSICSFYKEVQTKRQIYYDSENLHSFECFFMHKTFFSFFRIYGIEKIVNCQLINSLNFMV